MRRSLLSELVRRDDPCEAIVEYIEAEYLEKLNLNSIESFYHRLEYELAKLELWLYEVWGLSFYKDFLAYRGLREPAITRAFRYAKECGGNVLVSDGFSVRELLVIKRALGDRFRKFELGYAPAPTLTSNVARIVFNVDTMHDAFTGLKTIEDKVWRMVMIEDVENPPRIGAQGGTAFFTYHPDGPLHHAERYGVKFYGIDRAIRELVNLVNRLLKVGRPLVVTGDHGYIFIGGKPEKTLWPGWRRAPRCGGDITTYGKLHIKIDDIGVAVGRRHCDITAKKRTISHGGISITESIVPIVLLTC